MSTERDKIPIYVMANAHRKAQAVIMLAKERGMDDENAIELGENMYKRILSEYERERIAELAKRWELTQQGGLRRVHKNACASKKTSVFRKTRRRKSLNRKQTKRYRHGKFRSAKLKKKKGTRRYKKN